MKQYLFLALLFITSLHVKAQNFFPLGSGFNYEVKTLFADTATDIIYAGGNFTVAGGVAASKIAQWNGLAWDSLGSGVNDGGFVSCMTKYKGEIYVGGSFQKIGGITAKGLAKWDGTNWLPFVNASQGVSGCVWGLFVINNELYVTGCFDTIAGMASNKIAKFDGTTWTAFPSLDTTGGGWAINCAAFYNGELYVGGNFDSQITTNMKDIAKWDGSAWQSVGNGLTGSATIINEFEIYNNKLYVGGYFQLAGGDPGNNIIKWDGSNWSQLGIGTSNQVFGLKVYNNKLYVSGAFLSAGGVPQTADVAIWDSTNWSSTGGTFDNTTLCFTELNGDLYIGGGFWTVNGDTMNGITKYTGANGINDVSSGSSTINIYPNPTSGVFNVQMSKLENAQMKIYNVYGECIYQHISTSAHLKIDLSEASDGIYFVRVQTEQGMVSKKVVVLR